MFKWLKRILSGMNKTKGFRVTFGNREFVEVFEKGFAELISDKKGDITLIFSTNKPVVFTDPNNPMNRVSIELIDVELEGDA